MSFVCPSCGQPSAFALGLCPKCFDPEAIRMRCHAGTAAGHRCRRWARRGWVFCDEHAARFSLFSIVVAGRLVRGVEANVARVPAASERKRLLEAFHAAVWAPD
jgi:NMD protein affecting ribosome stability and mRNA decay